MSDVVISEGVGPLYRSFSYASQPLFQGLELATYREVDCAQLAGFNHVLNSLFRKQRFKNVVELGTGYGGTSLFLNDLRRLYGGDTFITFDSTPVAEKSSVGAVAFALDRIAQIVGDLYKDRVVSSLVKESVARAGKTLLFCDGGNKIAEFNMFAECLKPGDFIMLHDYAHDAETFKTELSGAWFWHEVSYADVMEAAKKNRMVQYDKVRMAAFAFGCFTKSG